MSVNNTKCLNCNPCGILSGYGGAGTFSDGKLNFIPKLGKSDLFKYMNKEDAYELIDEVEEIFKQFGMDSKIYPTNMDDALKLKSKIAKTGASLLIIKQKHLGSDKLPEYIKAFTDFLSQKGVEIIENADVYDIKSERENNHTVFYKKGNKKFEVNSKNVIVAPGRTILVLEDGKIVGKGKHDELMRYCEVYRQIALSQLSKEELAG